MAFFKNSKPNSVAGISFPTDGSDTLTIHLKHGYDAYKKDCMFFISLSGASCFNTSGGCMVTFMKHSDVAHMLEEAMHYFDTMLIDAVNSKRISAIESALVSPFDDDRGRKVVRDFSRKTVANQAGPVMLGTCVNIRTYLSSLAQE